MTITKVLTKKFLENIIKISFQNFGNLKTSQLLDTLKAFGFFYATSSGLSISLEDLKSPEIKATIREITQDKISSINQNWNKGLITDSERFQNILSQWAGTTELLKEEIINYYKHFDPANCLYTMAFSGARGNIDQVRQIVGIRGLMTDQAGNIITVPIENNFKEGLTSIDYLISAYGARKGLVDTALKTAVAGYLTRRLIFLAQSIIIRQLDCKSKQTLLVDLSQNENTENLIGRFCEMALQKQNLELLFMPKFSNCFINEKMAEFFKKQNFILKIKSPLTCKSEFSLCQKCYGWDLSKYTKVALGEAVGILAAQAIGEPGTQLTMRTFHTGGVFTGGEISINFFTSPLSGKIISYEGLHGAYSKTLFGENIIKLAKTLKINLFNWKNGLQILEIPKGLEFFISSSFFYKKGSKLANFPNSSILQNYKTQQIIPIYAAESGKIFKKKLYFQELSNGLCFALKNGRFSIALENLYIFHAKTNYRLLNELKTNKSLGFINIVIAPLTGFLYKNRNIIYIYSRTKKYSFDILNSAKYLKFFFFNKKNIQLKQELLFLVKNYQFIDKETVCARIENYPKIDEKICQIIHQNTYKIWKKKIHCIKQSDTFQIYMDQTTNIYLKNKKNILNNLNKKLISTLEIPLLGNLIKKDGFHYIFQRTQSFNIPKGSLFYLKKQKNFLNKNDLLFHSTIYKQQANDIVQSLPKINRIIDGNNLILNDCLFYAPNLLLKGTSLFKITNKSRIKNIFYSYIGAESVVNNHNDKKNLLFLQTDNNYINENSLILNSLFASKKNINFRFLNTKWTIPPAIFKGQNNIFSIVEIKNQKKNWPFLKFFYSGQNLFFKNLNAHLFLLSNFYYYSTKTNCLSKASNLALQKLQLILVNSMQSVYYHQGVNISSKHIELIIKQLTSKILLENLNLKSYFQKEIIYLSIFQIYKQSLNSLYEKFIQNLVLVDSIKINKKMYKMQLLLQENHSTFFILPLYLGCTSNSALLNVGFLTSAGFQDTKRILTKASIFGNVDWLLGLKDSLISGKIASAGSTYFYNKNYLDTFYFYKK